jgi:2-desacetyl-2-hydroxyethyl bacteriochlorophyllide A dehydrogenase
MKAVVLERPGQFRVMETPPIGNPKPGEATVLVKTIGICGTDLRAFGGNQPFFQYPRVLGHELGVEILEIGANEKRLTAGDQCAVEPYLSCGHCSACKRGRTNCCKNVRLLGVHIDGGMLGALTVPISKLHKSEGLSLDQLALVETLSVGAHAVGRAALQPGETVLIVGVGPIGLAILQSVRKNADRVIVVDISAKRLEFCRNTMKVEDCIDARSSPLAQLRELLNGNLPTAIFDCTGSKESMEARFNYVEHAGKLVFVGLFNGDLTFNDPNFHQREMTVLSSRNATGEDFRQIMEGMRSGQIDIKPWVTHRVSSESIIDILPEWASGENDVIKAIVEW